MTLTVDHRVAEWLKLEALAGYSESTYDGPMRLQTFIDAIDTDNFSLDFRGGRSSPLIGFGEDVSNPKTFTYAPGRADGTVTGGFSTQGKPSYNITKNTTAELSGTVNFTETLALKVGGQYRESDFNSRFANLVPSQAAVRPLPTGTSLASITRYISGLDDLWGGGAPASWLAVDANKWREVFGFDSFQFCGVECGAAKNRIRERWAVALPC